jgi:hypothetical protein
LAARPLLLVGQRVATGADRLVSLSLQSGPESPVDEGVSRAAISSFVELAGGLDDSTLLLEAETQPDVKLGLIPR